jgi:hypothetical protein
MALSTMDVSLRPAAIAPLPALAVERPRHSGQCGRLGTYSVFATPSVRQLADWLRQPGSFLGMASCETSSAEAAGLGDRAVTHADFPGGLARLLPMIGGDGSEQADAFDRSAQGAPESDAQPTRAGGSTESREIVGSVPPGGPPEVPDSSRTSGEDPQDWASLVREARELLAMLPRDNSWREEIGIALEEENSVELPWLVESGWFDVFLARIAKAGERFGLAELDCERDGFCLDLRMLEEPTPEQAAANGTDMPLVKLFFEGGVRPLRHRPVGERPVAVVTEFETGHLGRDRARHLLAAVLAAHDLVVTQTLHFRLEGGQMPTADDVEWALHEAAGQRMGDLIPRPHPEVGAEWVARIIPAAQ